MDRRSFVALGLASSAALAAAVPERAFAAAPAATGADPIDVPLPPAAWTKTYGNLQVQKFGDGGLALILVPGLSCGTWAWNGTIASESKTRTVYAVTAGGFGGVPPAQPQTLDGIVASLAQLIQTEKIDRPVLVGHSLGGTVVLKFGIVHPELARGIVSVDGTPVFPFAAELTPAERLAQAEHVGATLTAAPPDRYASMQTKAVDDYVTDRALAARVEKLSALSDQASVGAYTTDLIATDLRPSLPKLTLPTLLIAPVPFPPLPSYLPATMEPLDDQTRVKVTSQFYATLFAGAPHLTIVTVPKSRHFVMLDQPGAFAVTLDTFLSGLS